MKTGSYPPDSNKYEKNNSIYLISLTTFLKWQIWRFFKMRLNNCFLNSIILLIYDTFVYSLYAKNSKNECLLACHNIPFRFILCYSLYLYILIREASLVIDILCFCEYPPSKLKKIISLGFAVIVRILNQFIYMIT